MDHPRAGGDAVAAPPLPSVRLDRREPLEPLDALESQRPHEVTVTHRGMFAVAACHDCDWTGRARRALSSAREDADLHRNLGAGL